METLYEGINSENGNSLEKLKSILENRQSIKLCPKDVQEIASTLISLFEILAEGDANEQ
jgi:hypothetical protein